MGFGKKLGWEMGLVTPPPPPSFQDPHLTLSCLNKLYPTFSENKDWTLDWIELDWTGLD